MRDVLTATYRVRDLKLELDLTLNGQLRRVARETFTIRATSCDSPRYNSLSMSDAIGGRRRRCANRRMRATDYYDEDEPGLVARRTPDRVSLRRAIEGAAAGLRRRADGSHVREIARLTRRHPAADVGAKRQKRSRCCISRPHIVEAGALAPGARDVGVIGTHGRRAAAGNDRRRRPAHCACVTPATPTSTNTAGRPTAARSPRPTPRETATTTGGSRASRVSTLRPERCTICSRPPYQIDDPQWSPDGKQHRVIGGIMSDFGVDRRRRLSRRRAERRSRAT